MTGLQDRKYGRWFKGADIDGDGFITRRDVLLMSERYITARGLPPDSEGARLLAGQMDGFWTNVIAPMDQDGDGRVDLREMTDGFKRALGDAAQYARQIGPVADCFFDLVDLNGDGKIDLSEFRLMFDAVAAVPGGDSAEVFAALDLDGSGGLDRGEFHQAILEFFYGDDPDAAANHLFGRIDV
ncbi:MULTISPECIES: EF-hand domain-containing protein [Kitasatospora]|uniref:EF-hand domain-containing protein n=1 Tax=Kitasatospora setae (strain ATCC 33774 / DSM 43861 / JCM 3304 / KCC A-0304 / NBRC 14216 / KM-6054) TaxID=452652 RepID=E4N6A5_KITSK|nr:MULTISPECIES: EF-hand domain-containing protein [Kitasatospora]BAJ26736.1 hypothetical protein KSE_08990 [Kitasatospora setae KM-6054]